MSKELEIGQNLKLLSESIKLSAEVTNRLLTKHNWKPNNKEVLVVMVNSLEISMNCLQKLINEQMTIIELERIMKGVKDER